MCGVGGLVLEKALSVEWQGTYRNSLYSVLDFVVNPKVLKKKKNSLFKKLDETDSKDDIRKPSVPLFILVSMKERRKDSVKNQDIDVSIKISLNCYFN